MKRMIYAAALAVMLHVLVFRMEMPWARPVLQMQHRDAVAISLVPAPQPQVRPVALPEPKKISPLQQLPEKKKETQVAKPEPWPLNDEDFEPVPPPDEGEPPEDEDDGEEIDAPQNDDDPSNNSEAVEPPQQTGNPSHKTATPDDIDPSAGGGRFPTPCMM